jgi:hypothetical protein
MSNNIEAGCWAIVAGTAKGDSLIGSKVTHVEPSRGCATCKAGTCNRLENKQMTDKTLETS